MGKKRSREAANKVHDEDRMEDSDSGEDFDVVNVEFEWFNFDLEVDFHGTKTLLRQLLDVDAALLDVSGLADCILAQSTIGSTVKVDGKANDAYAMLTALSLREQRENKAVAQLTQYLADKAAAAAETNAALAPLLPLLSDQSSGPSEAGKPHIGLILSERLINMPAEIAPPLYTMLMDEVEAAVEDGEPYQFTHYLILSKTYEEVQSDLAAMVVDDDDDDEDDSGKSKKRKKAKTAASGSSTSEPFYYFHPEDEVLRKHAVAAGTFPYTKIDESVADSKRAFQELGVKSQGLLMLIEAGKLPAAVEAVSKYVQSA
ncbi:protein BCP1 [Sporothrix brasiliensis 5110]|uniref:Protein BCP1 n=1 Tax=Sporothrix brasiliensis 5110 TaxID=1398154 RepID=A0A0C2ESK9_9PEZI|nr:protein BCP1 [Sporothrix brasiliensis 5110]KIH89364.1 protein BCP1 [Sporothrix brasiliensis 5110]